MKRQLVTRRREFRCCCFTIAAASVMCILRYGHSYVLLPPSSRILNTKYINTDRGKRRSSICTSFGGRSSDTKRCRLWGKRSVTSTSSSSSLFSHDPSHDPLQDERDNNSDNKENETKKRHLQERRLAAMDYIKVTTKLKNKNKDKTGVTMKILKPQNSNSKQQRKQKQLSSVAASYQLLDHNLLTKSEEYELGIKIRESVDLLKKIDTIIKQKKQEQIDQDQYQLLKRVVTKKKKIKFQKRKKQEERQKQQRKRMMEIYSNPNETNDYNYNTNVHNGFNKYNNNQKAKNKNNNMSMEEELEELLLTRRGRGTATSTKIETQHWYGDIGDDREDDDDNILMEELGMAIYGIDHHYDHDQQLQQKQIEEDFNNDDDIEHIENYFDRDNDDDDDTKNNNYDHEFKSSFSSRDSNSINDGDNNKRRGSPSPSQIGYNLDEIRMYLTENEIIEILGIDGGRDELNLILINGALAKQKMIKSNIRLVTSIAKKWFRNSSNSKMDSNNAYGSHNSYSGSWTTPAMDEVVQQGIIGLAMAAERFEPERNFKFSTYATYYITNEVRKIFQSTTTGCLYVPQHYFGIKNKYQQLVKKHFRETGHALDLETAAKTLNLKIARLQFVLRSTEPLLQLDSPISGGETEAGKAGGSQGGSSAGATTFSDTLQSEEATAESLVERSLLRQCLENALAAELSPHERDIVRLRHGLDDGVSRTVKQVRESCGGMLSLSDIRTVESKAYRKLRFPHSIHNARLREFAEEYIGLAPERLEA